MVCKLQRSLYGLKQAPRQWYKKFDSFMVQHGFKRTLIDQCVFVKKLTDVDFLILLLYVDDMLIVGKNIAMINDLKTKLSTTFEMKDWGKAEHILGMQITRDRNKKKLWLSQEQYILKVLQRFNMFTAKPVSCPLGTHFKLSSKHSPQKESEMEIMRGVPYASAVGSLTYAMICTRPDIAYSVGLRSRFLANPGKEHREGVKWILRYLKGTYKFCICYGSNTEGLLSFTDSDMAGDIDSMRSTSGYLFTYAGGVLSWKSKLHKCVALSTTEVEYIAVTE
ncbi:transmembrane signal receptor [Lithospermum erythrorhizon]|uniref:Transmembrane signal receptor n=1 Tax=Lithospermum erythrorhizon TaxID=34254 RepID=A0AAV3NT93_LITER